MILVRAPVRISFLGGGTDLPDFYTRYPGRVISTAIDKYVYVTVNRPPLVRNISVRYGISETVIAPKDVKNDRVREALLHFGISNNIDIGTFPDVPVKTGLGSSSSFTVALVKALFASQGERIHKKEIAELASHIEINLVKEPIGKQDQYAAAFGGFNIFQFNLDHSVEVAPVHLGFKARADFENHILLFYTGISRLASSVLQEQKTNIKNRIDILKKMSDSVFKFHELLIQGDFAGLGAMLHEGWLMKKTLASNVSNPLIDAIYSTGINAGAWGGKVLGAGAGGCILFLAPTDKKKEVREAILNLVKEKDLNDFLEIPVKFVQSGVEVLVNHGFNEGGVFA